MSTDYYPNPSIKFADVEKADFVYNDIIVTHDINDEVKPGENCCLTNGFSFIWAYKNAEGNAEFTRFGLQWEIDLLIEAIEGHFKTRLVHEEEALEDEENDEDE